MISLEILYVSLKRSGMGGDGGKHSQKLKLEQSMDHLIEQK
jgi:hypothetical protein